jgi:hypothetical protein
LKNLNNLFNFQQKHKAMKVLFIALFLLGVNAVFSQTNPEEKVAILPVSYVNDASEGEMTEMRYQIQTEIFSFLDKNKSKFSVQSPEETNALLLKSNIGYDDLRKYTMAELAALLHVQYIVSAEVMQRKTRTRTNYETRGDDRDRRDDRKDRRDDRRDRRTRRTVTRSETEEFSNKVALTIHNDRGETLYKESRKSMHNSEDGYFAALRYLLKRSPVYSEG